MISSNFLKNLRKTTGSTSFKDSKYANPSHYINTGDYALNRIISGDVHLGIPAGRVIILAGETGTLKTVQAIKIAVNALNENDYDIVFYFDSEGGAPRDMVENMGGDPANIEHVIVDSVEDATVKILNTYQAILVEKEKNPDFKALLIMDSIGATLTEKLNRDVAKNQLKADMGGSAKLIGTMVRGCTIPALKSDASIIFINHIYKDPASLYETKIQNQSGGLRLQYMATVTIQCTKKLSKPEEVKKPKGKKKKENDNEEIVETEEKVKKPKAIKEEAFYSGSVMKFFTVKNRIARQFMETEVYVDFKKGFGEKKYLGLIEPALRYGIITNETQGYFQIPSIDDKKYRRTQLEGGKKADEIWSQILDDFNEKSKEDMKYSSVKTIDEIIESTESDKIEGDE